MREHEGSPATNLRQELGVGGGRSLGGGSSAYRSSGSDVELYSGESLGQLMRESREELVKLVHLVNAFI